MRNGRHIGIDREQARGKDQAGYLRAQDLDRTGRSVSGTDAIDSRSLSAGCRNVRIQRAGIVDQRGRSLDEYTPSASSR